MKPRILAAALAVAIIVLGLSAGAARADQFDAGRLTCADRGSDDQITLLLYWLDGYLAARIGDTLYSDSWIETLRMAIEAECQRDPKQTLISIVEQLKS